MLIVILILNFLLENLGKNPMSFESVVRIIIVVNRNLHTVDDLLLQEHFRRVK